MKNSTTAFLMWFLSTLGLALVVIGLMMTDLGQYVLMMFGAFGLGVLWGGTVGRFIENMFEGVGNHGNR